MTSLTYRDVVDILGLLREAEHCEALDLEMGSLKLSVRRAVQASEATVALRDEPASPRASAMSVLHNEAPARPPLPQPSHADESLVRAPLLGTFYRALQPGTPACVEVGDVVAPDDTVGLIEVMKLFTQVTAGRAGRVVEVFAEDATLVEHGQPLLRIEPLAPTGA